MHESLRLYQICKMMKWNHLPSGGGLYDQHPKFLDDMLIIRQAEMSAEKERQEKEKRRQDRQKANSPKPSRGTRGRRR